MSVNDEILEKIYCFSENELGILLGAAGINQFLCFDYGQKKGIFKVLSTEESNETIIGLIKAGVLSVNDDSYSVCEEVKKILKVLKEYSKILFYLPGNPCRDVISIYLDKNKNYVIARPGRRECEYIQLSVANGYTFEDFFSTLITDDEFANNHSDRIKLYKDDTNVLQELILEYRFGIPHIISIGEKRIDYSKKNLSNIISEMTEV